MLQPSTPFGHSHGSRHEGLGFCNPTLFLGLRVLQPNTPFRAWGVATLLLGLGVLLSPRMHRRASFFLSFFLSCAKTEGRQKKKRRRKIGPPSETVQKSNIETCVWLILSGLRWFPILNSVTLATISNPTPNGSIFQVLRPWPLCRVRRRWRGCGWRRSAALRTPRSPCGNGCHDMGQGPCEGSTSGSCGILIRA